MILLFLGSWRSTVIIAISIPLAVLAAIIALSATGNTLNIMTLGGLSLAVGILVDDATVTIENINWHLEQGKSVIRSILDGAAQIVTPAFVSLLCICIVFVPMFFLPGVSGFLFVPLALSVVFAMIASFILSRTLVPTMAMYLLKPHAARYSRGRHADLAQPAGALPARLRASLRAYPCRLRRAAGACACDQQAVHHRLPRGGGAVVRAGAVPRAELLPVGRCRPDHDARPRAGRFTHRGYVGAVRPRSRAASARSSRPKSSSRSSTISACRSAAINTVYNNSGTIGPQDGDILIQLSKDHAPTADYVRKLREQLPSAFPGTTFSFLPPTSPARS
jgi:hypothetical protein